MSIRKVEPFDDPASVEQIVSVYQEAFGGEPWNEGYLCPICGATFPLVSPKTCKSCFDRNGIFVLLVGRWPKSKVVSDFYREMAKPKALCFVAEEDNKVVAFAWGYKIEMSEDTDAELEAPGLHKLVCGEYFYLDEVAVLPTYQRQGVGKELLENIFAGQKRVLLRTLKESQMFRLTKKLGGKALLDVSRGRVIMALAQ